jgi:hypothetical protein
MKSTRGGSESEEGTYDFVVADSMNNRIIQFTDENTQGSLYMKNQAYSRNILNHPTQITN